MFTFTAISNKYNSSKTFKCKHTCTG